MEHAPELPGAPRLERLSRPARHYRGRRLRKRLALFPALAPSQPPARLARNLLA